MANPHLIHAIYGFGNGAPLPQERAAPAPAPSKARPATGGVKSKKPTTVTLEVTTGVVKQVIPLEFLAKPMERFLPPPALGFYYDQVTLDEIFGPDKFTMTGKCLSCWGATHTTSLKHCTSTCTLCDTNSHIGAVCFTLYAPVKWWRSRGYIPSPQMQTRPGASEVAHLVLAGVIKPMKKLWDPIKVNMEHHLVKKFYGENGPPTRRMRQLPNVSTDGNSKVKEELGTHATEAYAPNDTSAVSMASAAPQAPSMVPHINGATHQPQLQMTRTDPHAYCDSEIRRGNNAIRKLLDELERARAEIEQLRGDLGQARAQAEERDRRIEELEASSSGTGDKRRRLVGDVGRKDG